MSWTLKKRATFEASHRLPHHDGKCARLHGHSWTVVLEVRGDALQTSGPQTGMVVDFGRVGAPLKALVESSLDHFHLNDTTGLESPTSEALAQWIYDRLAWTVPGLTAVTVCETCTSAATYHGPGTARAVVSGRQRLAE